MNVGDKQNVAFTIRGCTGFVLGAPIINEKAIGSVAEAIAFVFEEPLRAGVEWLATDLPTVPLLERLKEILPNLKSLCNDTTHFAMNYENAFGHKRTYGSRMLRKMRWKFNVPISTGD